MSHEQPQTNEAPKNPVESGKLPDTTADKAALSVKTAEQQKKDEAVKAEKLAEMKKEPTGIEKAVAKGKEMGVMGAKGVSVAAGAGIGAFFAGIWGLFKLYGDALFGDIMPKGGGSGGKKSSGGGHGGGGHSGGHH